MENCIVYQHRKLDTNEIFYIGIGKSEKRAYWTHQRNRYWRFIVKKHGYLVEILETGLTWQQACEMEIDLIDMYGRKDLGTGILCNMTDGGEGGYNQIWTEDSRKKLSNSLKGKTLGKKQSEEAKLKISKAMKGRTIAEEHKKKISDSNTGKIISDEVKLKMSIASKGKRKSPDACKNMSKFSSRNRKVLDTVTGTCYISASEASRLLNIPKSSIQNWLSGRRTNKSNLIYC